MTFAYAAWHPTGAAGPLPTVVAIHGHGAHGQDLLGLAPYVAPQQLLWVCPQAEFPLMPGYPTYTWFQRDGDGPREGELERVAGALQGFIDDLVPQLGGDPARTVILGFSQGGTIAYRLGLGTPGRYAGVAALSTYLPDAVAAGLDGARIGAVPLLVQHGTEDQMIAVQRAQASRDLLLAIGAQPEYHEYPMAHEIGGQSLADLNEWLARVLRLEAGA